jgi:1-phosphofructokinase
MADAAAPELAAREADMVAGTIAVLAPAVYVSITIEGAEDGDDIHVHAGGQGIWVARMLRQLDHQPVVCAPVGGETGRTLLGLVGDWAIDVQSIETLAETPAYVHDRRDGERVEFARSPPPTLRRHELDELYDRFLEVALHAHRCVVTGPEGTGSPPASFYRRLGKDLEATGIEVVADLHGDALDAYLEGGPISALKVSSDDLVEDGRLDEGGQDDALDRVADGLVERGVQKLVISHGPSILATTPEGRFRVTGPELDPVDTRGSGDSMTAALATSLAQDLDTATTLARAWAAGAANVTRHGLGSANATLIDRLSGFAEVEAR